MLSSSGRYEPFRSAIIARASETEVPLIEGFDLAQTGAYDGPFRGRKASTWRSVVMVVKRREIALSVTSTIAAAVVLACSVALVAQKKDDKKQTDAQKKEILDIVKIVDAAAAGQSASNDFGLAWNHEDYLKATSNKEYIPFTVTFDASKVTSPNIALYWRVVAKDAAAPAATLNLPAKKDDKDKKDDKKAPAKYAYEDVNFVPVNTAQGANARLSRAFTVAAGSYDVYVVLKEPASSQKNAPAPKVSLIKQTVTVPAFWSP